MASQNQRVYDLENLTYAIIKTRCEKKLKTKYPKLKFTQEEQSDSATASFPPVLVHALEPIEQNEDLECERINTVLFTAQVIVTTNKSRSEALNVAQTVANEYKAMSFKLAPAPFARNNGKIWTATLRARRSFVCNDSLLEPFVSYFFF